LLVFWTFCYSLSRYNKSDIFRKIAQQELRFLYLPFLYTTSRLAEIREGELTFRYIYGTASETAAAVSGDYI
jgi:hypothetical protein